MAKPTVYVETSVIGYLTSRPYSQPEVAGHQASTRKWWKSAQDKYTLVVSQVVISECGKGDPDAAQDRMASIASLDAVPVTTDVERLTENLLSSGAVPRSEPEDAAHIALAAVHGVKYLVTWNFKHIANASRRRQIEGVIEAAGFLSPMICSVDELLGEYPNVE